MNFKKLFAFNSQIVFLDAIMLIFGAILFNVSARTGSIFYLGLILILFAIIHFVLNLMFGVAPKRRR
ncbi:MAG: hypothetical protein HYV68_00495 [Candidatus Taylorbacteria bacterium]|nr:hypothetical protein [Candidatus Taylorbacteria bacterium]